MSIEKPKIEKSPESGFGAKQEEEPKEKKRGGRISEFKKQIIEKFERGEDLTEREENYLRAAIEEAKKKLPERIRKEVEEKERFIEEEIRREREKSGLE